jgi:RNA polymerase sigma-70 factor (ECF subfamily)
VRDVLSRKEGAPDRLVDRIKCLARFMAALNARSGQRFDSHELADLVQDSLLVVWRKLDRFRGPEGLDSWVLRIARFEFQNASRKKARRAKVVGSLDEGTDIRAPGDGPRQELERQTLSQVMEELDHLAARTVHLKHYEDLTFEEIGKRMGCSQNTAKTRYYRSLGRLARALESLNP